MLDQGEDGACTGFGLAAVVNFLLFSQSVGADPAGPIESVSPAMLYRLARRYDEWPGEDYEGSSCRGALKGWRRHGVCRAKLWPYVANKHVRPREDESDRASDALTRRYSGLPTKYRPLDPDDAYRHAIVMDRGFPTRSDITLADAAEALATLAYDWPLAFKRTRNEKKQKLLIYAHGGLNSESASIQRIRMLAPYALDAGLYPLFLTCRSGPLETISDMAEEVFARIGIGARGELAARGFSDRFSEKTDRLIEPLLRAPGGSMGSRMKRNATRASADRGGACRLLVKQLKRLAESGGLELHRLGHSAGAIVLGALLDRLREASLPVASLRLFAPACTTRFALAHFEPAVKAKTLARENFFIHVLCDANERADSLGPYRKSLLYLVSRAFEEEHKTPLLGLEQSFDPTSIAENLWSERGNDDVRRWLEFWRSHPAGDRNAIVLADRKVSNGVDAIDASHGCFDDAVAIMSAALSHAAGQKVRVLRLDTFAV